MKRSPLKITLLYFAVLIDSAAGQESALRDEVSYSNDIEPVIKNFCTTCHSGEDPEGDLTLTSYNDVRTEAEEGDLLHRINDADDPMPEDGLMPKHLRRVFALWAKNGYLEKGTLEQPKNPATKYGDFTPPAIEPIDISTAGFELLESLQGHWVGSMTLMGTEYDWMAFDYRPISPSHIHGIFEGGTVGNLFTSFFVADFKGVKTIMARNGGMLNGIYRTSYFVLDRIQSGFREKTYRLVDAYGGSQIMSMELTFRGDSVRFRAYTSRLGLKTPGLHMDFRGKRKRPELANAAARLVGFPQNIPDFRFPDPIPTPTWAGDYPLTSATYLCDRPGTSLIELGKESRDPRRIDQIPYLSKLTVSIKRSKQALGKKLLVFLSQQALTDEMGKFIKHGRHIRNDLLDSLLLFPELGGKVSEFTFTYLHPGDYFLTAVADMDNDGYPSPGDISHPVTQVTVRPESHVRVSVSNLNAQN